MYNKYKELFMLDIEPKIKQDLFEEIIPEAHFVFIYRLSRDGKIEVIYDNSFGKISKTVFLSKKEIHDSFHKKAFENKKIVYDWFLKEDKTDFYQSTLIPLQDNLGQVQSVFGLVKGLKNIKIGGKEKTYIADRVGESFAYLLIKVREEEKRQIARAFHDEVGSSAVLLNSVISILKMELEQNNKKSALEKLQELEDVVRQISQRMRKIIISVRPPQLKEIGLKSAIKDLIDSLKKSSEIKFHFVCDISDKENISEEVKSVLYRCVQESVNNVFKHAKAKNIWVSLKDNKSSVLLTVEDDGVGYKKTKTSSVKHIGLLGMKESALNLGGSFDIKGNKGQGTLIKIVCPKISYMRKVQE